MELKIKKLRENSIMPTKATEFAAGWDCYISGFGRWNSQLNKVSDLNIERYNLVQNKVIACMLGFSTEIPPGYYAKVVPRSGLAIKHGITIINSPGTIDSDYRGEWIAIMSNLSSYPHTLSVGDKICQFIIDKCIDVDLIVNASLSESERGANGFGSSDKSE